MMRYRRWPQQSSNRGGGGGGGGGSSSRRGFRINSKRFCVRGRFIFLSRWKIWYGQALKKIVRLCNKRSSRTRLVVDRPECQRLRSFNNSFYSEAIADCLDFIKRSSISVHQTKPSAD